jgi:hypothetical protein
VTNAALFRPLGFERPDQPMLINEIVPELIHLYPRLPVNAKHFFEWKARMHSFADVAILDSGGVNLTGKDGPPERVGVGRVSFNFFPVLGVRPLLGRRFQTLLLAGFAVAELLLSAIGVYGVISYAVSRRRNEIGIRMALGARLVDVTAMVLLQGMRSVAIGLAVGIFAAPALGRFLETLLYEIHPSNPLIIAAAVAVLGSAAGLACYLPARRATLVDPATALRCD